MERLIVCCIGSKYRSFERVIRSNYEVIAISDVGYPDGAVKDGIPFIDRSKIKNYVFDKVMVCSTLYYQEVKRSLEENGVPKDKICCLDALTPFISDAKRRLLIRECDADAAPYEYFATEVRRPKYARDVSVRTSRPLKEKVGIVLQGPIRREDDFTLETVRLYRKLYPEVKIIVSGWEGEDDDIFHMIEEEGAYVCRSTPPENRGYANINMQIVSTTAGMRRAKEIGCNYVLKSRTDQRMYAPLAMHLLVQLHNRYKMDLDCKACGRIVTFGTGMPFCDMPYYICDYFNFGYTEDILKYFSPPLVSEGNEYMDRFYETYNNGDLDQAAKMRCPEIYFCSHWLESLGFHLKWTREESQFFSNHLFVRIDALILDWIWPKYTYLERRGNCYNGEFGEPMNFMEWFLDQSVLEDKS